MNATAEAAIGRCQHPLPSDDVGEAHDALGDELGVFDDIGGVADDTWQEQLGVGQPDLLPDLPFVLVADIAGLERIGAGAPSSWPRGSLVGASLVG